MTVGITSVSNARQTGHWRSMYSTIVAGALALPSTFPCCGMSANWRVTKLASGRTVAVVEPEPELPPAKTTISAIATASPARPASAPNSTAGDARRPSVLRTGGRATWAWRWRRACLPLVIGPLTVATGGRWTGGQQEEGEAEREAGEREHRDGHVAELFDPLGGAAPWRRDQARPGLLDDAVLDEQVVDRDAGADERQRQQVAGGPALVRQRRQQRHDRERVHADALEPAELARDEARDLREEEAAAGRDRRDEEHQPEIVALDRPTQRVARAAQAGQPPEPHQQQEGRERLARD